MKSIFRSRRYRRRSPSQQPFFQSAESESEYANEGNTFFPPAAVGVQTKLTIGQPNDKYEREADTMADRVVSQQSAGTRAGQQVPGVQAMCADCKEEKGVQRMAKEEEPEVQTKQDEEEVQRMTEKEEPEVQKQEEKEEVQMKEEEEEVQAKEEEEESVQAKEEEEVQTKPLMRKSAGGSTVGTSTLATQLSNSRGGGQPMAANTQAQMSQAFRQDFGGVRVHTGARAAEMSKGLGARAFTHGSDIYFNQGEYRPESTAGKRLLAHELTHVVQQGGESNKAQRSVTNTIQTKPGVLNLNEKKKGKVQGCGELSDWIIQWNLDKPSVKGGHIIQKATRYSKINNCKGEDITLTKTGKRLWQFWEAWPIKPGDKVTSDGPDDDYFSHPDRGNNTTGEVAMIGQARFYEGLNTLPKSFQKNNPNTLAIDLPSTTTDPKLKGGTVGAGRVIEYNWDCCKVPSKRTTKSRYKY